MAGILDKKSRIIDYVITDNGRSQLENNDIRYKYATFSDKSIIYTKDFDLSSTKKSDITDSEIQYIPLEVTSKGNTEINPEFDLRKYFFGSNIELNISDINQNRITEAASIDTYLTSYSLSSHLKNLKYLKTKSILNVNRPLSFFNNLTINKDINFNNDVLRYTTIKNIVTHKSMLPVIALDRRFTHKNNFKFLPPKTVSGEDLYEKENFKKIEDLNEDNVTGYLFPAYKMTNTDESFSRKEEILKILNHLENNNQVNKKEFIIENSSENDSLIFELHEVIRRTDTADTLTKLNLEKLHFVKIGEFYDRRSVSTKKVYLIGKFFNTRENSKDLDVLFSFNDGKENLSNNNKFAFSAYFSFVCLFTLVIE